MTTPSGTISLSDVNVELGYPSATTISLNDAEVRGLAGVPSGEISMSDLQNKSNTYEFTISSPVANGNLNTLATQAGWDGSTKYVATIDTGVYIYSTSPGSPGLIVPASPAGTTEIINNGYIMGMGGAGGPTSAYGFSNQPGSPGSPAISISQPVTITNNSYIAGGGGGGGGSSRQNRSFAAGGGGAGGASGGGNNSGSYLGGVGGSIGSSGTNGDGSGGSTGYSGGGGSGRIIPGTGGAGVSCGDRQAVGGRGGGAGGGGGCTYTTDGDDGVDAQVGGGGGGGWGAAGGGGGQSGASGGAGGSAGDAGSSGGGGSQTSGGSGGNAVSLNGNTVTWVVEGTRYGATS